MKCPHCNVSLDEHRNPVPTVDIIIELNGGVVLVKRKYEPKGWALPGGFVDYGESFEKAAIREAYEETGLNVLLTRQLHTYSDPNRDQRMHTASTVFIGTSSGKPKAGDDAGEVKVFAKENIPAMAFDHNIILDDYFKSIGESSANR